MRDINVPAPEVETAMDAPSPSPDLAPGLRRVVADVVAERKRQVEVEGWTLEHDDKHRHGELADAAAVYAAGGGLFHVSSLQVPKQVWPYRWEYKTTTRRRDLVKAAALIVAEIERLDRAALASQEPKQ